MDLDLDLKKKNPVVLDNLMLPSYHDFPLK